MFSSSSIAQFVFHRAFSDALLSVDKKPEERFNNLKKASDIVGAYLRSAAIFSALVFLVKHSISIGYLGFFLAPFAIVLLGIFVVFLARMASYLFTAFWDAYILEIYVNDAPDGMLSYFRIMFWVVSWIVVATPLVVVCSASVYI